MTQSTSAAPAGEMAQQPERVEHSIQGVLGSLSWCLHRHGNDEHSKGVLREQMAFLSVLHPAAPEPEREPAAGGREAGWQPADSAPRDGRHILVAQFGAEGFGLCGGIRQPWQAVVHYWANPGEEGFYLSSGDSGGNPLAFTHWRALGKIGPVTCEACLAWLREQGEGGTP